jgi:hypothetical protein
MKQVSKKAFVYLAIILVILITSGVFAEQVGLSNEVKKVVDGIIEKKGISSDNIESVQEVSFDQLPEQIDVKNIDNTNLAVYEVKPIEGNSFFVITASDEVIQRTQRPDGTVKMVLNFGYNGVMEDSDFLRTSTGVETNLEKGYVMMRKGSITGLSTNLESVSGTGNIEVMVYKNGESVGFRNSFVVDSAKVMKDYDIQSPGTVNFEQGDVISMYVKAEGDVVWKDVITLIEISTE